MAFRPDKAFIYYDEQKKEIDDLLIGIYNKKMFKNNEYNALVGLEILK